VSRPDRRFSLAVVVLVAGLCSPGDDARADAPEPGGKARAALEFTLAIAGTCHDRADWIAPDGKSGGDRHRFLGDSPFPRLVAVLSLVLGSGERRPLPPLDEARLKKEWDFLRNRGLADVVPVALPERPQVSAVTFTTEAAGCFAWREIVTREPGGQPRDLVTGYRCAPAGEPLARAAIDATLDGYRVVERAARSP
jgi:hypothetical protein